MESVWSQQTDGARWAPVRHHWFYLRPQESYWIPFSLVDSARLETALLSGKDASQQVHGLCGGGVEGVAVASSSAGEDKEQSSSVSSIARNDLWEHVLALCLLNTLKSCLGVCVCVCVCLCAPTPDPAPLPAGAGANRWWAVRCGPAYSTAEGGVLGGASVSGAQVLLVLQV